MRGAVSFKGVHFAYPTSPQQPVLRGLSFSVPGVPEVLEPPSAALRLLRTRLTPAVAPWAADSTAALVGPSGCGKSTVRVQHMRSRVRVHAQCTCTATHAAHAPHMHCTRAAHALRTHCANARRSSLSSCASTRRVAARWPSTAAT